jgi:hypothetical protein
VPNPTSLEWGNQLHLERSSKLSTLLLSLTSKKWWPLLPQSHLLLVAHHIFTLVLSLLPPKDVAMFLIVHAPFSAVLIISTTFFELPLLQHPSLGIRSCYIIICQSVDSWLFMGFHRLLHRCCFPIIQFFPIVPCCWYCLLCIPCMISLSISLTITLVFFFIVRVLHLCFIRRNLPI